MLPTSMTALIALAVTLYALVPAARTKDDVNPGCVAKKSNPSHPPLPQLNMAAFTVEYRINIIDKKYSMRATEYFDFNHNKVRMDLQKNGIRQGLLFDYENDAYISYEYSDPEESQYYCVIDQLDLSKDDNFDIFGYWKGPSTKVPHVWSSRNILQFANEEEQEYKGLTTLDGVNVTHWQSCHYWQDAKANFTLDYYFTTESFQPLGKSTPHQVPVRAEVTGVIDAGGANRRIKHTYEFLNFKAYDSLPIETFTLPDYMMCDGDPTGWAKQFPSLPESMSYILERVTTKPIEENDTHIGIRNVRVFLDSKRRLVRTDQALLTSIQDYNTGVEYLIAQNGCKPSPMTKSIFSAPQKDGVMRMKDRLEIMYLKQKFYFSGPKRYREISALSFAGEIPDTDVRLMAYTTANDNTPIGLLVKDLDDDGTEIHYNFFEFRNTAYPPNDVKDPFDIRRCTDSNKINEFDITVTYDTDYTGKIQNWEAEIIFSLRDTTAQLAGCSVLQISSKEYRVDETKKEIQWFGFFLGAIPNIKAAKVVDQVPIKTYENFLSALYNSIQNGNFAQTIKVGESPSSFSVEVAGKVLRSQGNDYETSAVRQSPLNKFQELNNFCTKSLGDKKRRLVLNTAYECAKACLDSKWTECNVFQFSKTSKECTMSMKESLPTLSRTPGCNFYTLNYLSHFEQFPGEVLLKTDMVLHKQVSSPEVCARQCLNEETFKCESFDFCDDEDRCQLYKTHYYDKESSPDFEGEEISGCTHYSRKSLDDFTTIGSTDLALSGLIEVQAKSLQECAYQCAGDCAMFSSCLSNQGVICKFVTRANASEATFEHDIRCSIHKAPDSKTTSASTNAKDAPKSKRKGQQGKGGYSGGAMAGVALAMIASGVGIGALTIFLLRHFKMWNGF
ncbi:EF-hand domain-containing protein D1 [Elysia marginata]|uniref:EF-hand domain-containing protein D1 n=1 Tax=Elysia marginata TaxID=1093978 RepID=A0AAV4J0X5_9GAST|nr:EF-hand domain-containing protein D1 [Elysia marginata]